MEGHPHHRRIGARYGIGVVGLGEGKGLVKGLDGHPDLPVVAVGQSSRFFGSMRHQRRAYESGSLGKVSFVEASYVHDMRWFYETRDWANGPRYDLLRACCVHPVDLVRWYLGDGQEVHAYAQCSGTGERAGFHGDDTFIVNLRFNGGRIGRILGHFGLGQPHALRPWIEVGVYGDGRSMIASYPQLEKLERARA